MQRVVCVQGVLWFVCVLGLAGVWVLLAASPLA